MLLRLVDIHGHELLKLCSKLENMVDIDSIVCAHEKLDRRCVVVMYNTLAVLCSNVSIHSFIYLSIRLQS